MTCITNFGKASKSSNGYAKVYDPVTQKKVRAHRFVYEKENGAIPDGMVVMHTCDNRACVNPDHLILGTQSENIKDMYSKNRQGERALPKGEDHHFTILSQEEVRIFKETPYYRGLFFQWAKKHNVTRQTARNIYKGKTWKDV